MRSSWSHLDTVINMGEVPWIQLKYELMEIQLKLAVLQENQLNYMAAVWEFGWFFV